jgi:hypothetical protein
MKLLQKKDPAEDTSFPGSNADKSGLFYDSSTDMSGTEWNSNDGLPKIVPLVCKKILTNKITHTIKDG